MDLIDRLRPRWRHPDPDVRAAAVREMGREDHERLRAIAESDPEAHVRRIAIKRLDDADLLARLGESDPDDGLRELARERAREALVATAASDRPIAECEAALSRLGDERSLGAVAATAAHGALREAALARIAGDRALRDVVRGAADPAIRAAALDRIRDAGILRAVAVSDCPPELALRALARIDDPGELRAIAEHRAAAKSVRQRARELLASEAGERTPIPFKEGRARQLALCTEADALAVARDPLAAAERIREAEREWEEIARDVEPRADLAERFRVAAAAVREAAASLGRRLAEADHARTTIAERLEARRALCERVEELDGAEAGRELGRARAAWGRLAPVPEADGTALDERFARACEACAARHEEWRAREGLRSDVATLVGEAEALAAASPPPAPKRWKALERRWAAVDVAGTAAEDLRGLQERFASARARLEERWRESAAEREEQQRQNLARLGGLATRVAELAASETLEPRAARRELRAVEAAIADPGPLPPAERRAAWTERLSEARDALLRRVRKEEEAEEWRRWANVGAQEELILRVEALLESNDLAEGTRQLGRLQEEWASVATASPDKSQALWERFRAARNELRRRCDAYLAENLAKKRALAAEVRDAGDSTAWNETADLIRRVQAEWKAIGPVPGKHAKALWQEFREPCDRFFARRKEHFDRQDAARGEIAKRKTALCEQAEALADSTDWDATTAVMKRLQAEWKQSGPLPRGQSEALWQRFRTACDRFFDRRGRREEIAREDEMRKAEALCGALEALATSLREEGGPASEEVGKTVDEAWAEWVRFDLLPRDLAAAEGRVHAAVEAVAALRPESLRGTRLDPDVTRRRREKLCARLEELARAGSEAPRAMSLQEMAMALRDRLATNTIAGPAAGGGGRRQDVAREVERIDATWAHLGPPLDDPARELAARFAEARRRIDAAGGGR